MNVVIVGYFWFPHGSASGARVRNLALGLRECGARVHVIGMAPQPRLEGDGNAVVHEYEGVTYEYAAPTAASTDGWRDADRSIPRLRHGLVHKVRWFAGLYGAAPFARRRLRERIDRGQCDLMVAYDRSAVRMTPIVRLCRSRGIVSVLDVVEVSEHLSRSRLNAIYWDSLAGTRATPRLFDGLTVISAGLETLYRAQGCPHTLILPSIEAWPIEPPPRPTDNEVFRLAYVGRFPPRDAPDMLIGAMRILAHANVPVALDVIGHYEGTERGRYFARLCSEDAALGRAVTFHGSLSDAALAARLAASDGLVLTRRKARTEELSFPTRLVEYLRYGRPVFVSDVGDVSRYLRDGHDAVLLHPTDPARIAAQVADVVRNPERAIDIGRRGRESGRRSFDRRVHAARLLGFAEGLRSGEAS
jgi:glycosyltransferase involved in cell wall biosynthesis